MKKSDRYQTSHLVEDQFEPGSHGRVLRNLLGIKSKRKIDKAEAQEHLRALDELVKMFDQNHRFTAKDICKIHKTWLGQIYVWAGEYRQVNLSKGSFPFATSAHIPKLMTDFEKGPLHDFTPCCFKNLEEVTKALAVVHTELVLIHPFREGNGRITRLLSVLMALQAGLPPLNFDMIKGRRRSEYFAAVRAGLDKNYEPMTGVFAKIIQRTLKTSK